MRSRTVKIDGPLKFRKLLPKGPWIDINGLQCYCGLHTIKITVQVPPMDIVWPAVKRRKRSSATSPNNHKYYWKSVRIPQTHIQRESDNRKTKYVHLKYNKNGYLILTFEPDGDFPYDGTDLLPLHQWRRVWKEISETVANELHCPHLFSKYKARLTQFDFAFDIVYRDPSRLVRSLNYLPERRSLCRYRSAFRYSKKTTTKGGQGGREACFYDRSKKKGWEEYGVARFEFRNRKIENVRSALGVSRGYTPNPTHLSNRKRMEKYVVRLFKNYGIYENVHIVSLKSALTVAANPSVCASLANYRKWLGLGKYSYYSRRLRDIEGLVIGTKLVRGVSNVAGLYESFMAAFQESIKQ